MEWQVLNRTCTGGYLWDNMHGTKADIEKFLFSHAIMIVYNRNLHNPDPPPIHKALDDLVKAKAPNLRAICLGPYSATSTLWILRRGPEIKGERTIS